MDEDIQHMTEIIIIIMPSFSTVTPLLFLVGSTLAIPTPPAGNPYQPIIGSTCPPNNPLFNKQLVQAAYNRDLIVNRESEVDQYYHTDLIQHNPLLPDGLDALKNFAKVLKEGEGVPNFKRVGADGDLVWLHLDGKVLGVRHAIVEIFRVECGKIKEHWDVMQEIKSGSNAANPHPFF